ncbi:MAG: hypothetical protein Q9188_002498, partial [Gyalolechia gomerana]
GYKNRNARLDALEAEQPSYLAASTTPLANQTFADLDSEETLREIHDHLALKYALLDRVIRARKLHHSRFFSLSLDYGHQHYLDTLSNRRFIVVRALERLERRVSEVLYDTQKWFKWVRECQDEEDAARENEKKKVKKEAALFKRHVKEVQARMRALRAREDLKRQENYLEEAYSTRLSEEEQEAQWDPIEDVIEDERGNYIDLIKHILFLTESVDDAQGVESSDKSTQAGEEEASLSSNATRKGKKSKSKAAANGSSIALPDKSAHDTKSQLRKRLKEGVELSYGKGWKVAGTIENPIETYKRTAPIPDDVIDELLEQMTEIKHLLFCRLLLSHATVLPAAINANTVDEFLNDKDVTDADLRDLALRLDNPGLQEIRDACADLGREDEEEDDIYDEPDEDVEVDRKEERLRKLKLSNGTRTRRGDLPKTWAPEREKQVTKEQRERQSIVERSGGFGGMPEEAKGQTMIDFGDADNEGKFKSRKMRIRVCGRYIYNYPSERAISRGGWLQFCLIAKDSDLHDAIKLCRHWQEFFDLNILAIFQYFPAAKWSMWKGDIQRQQLLQLGFIPYMQFEGAEEMTTSFQTGSRGQARRAHCITEARNFLCGNVKRNDPVTRRFLQYLVMQSSRVVVLIRDAKTSNILSSPPKDQRWLNREKAGLGRASKNEWIVRTEVGQAFFEKMESIRQWHFGFNEYYDVYVWDLEAGQPWPYLYNTVWQTLVKAHRFCSIQDLYNPLAPILKTLTHDRETFRTRDIKPDEDVRSLWDEVLRTPNRRVDPGGETLEDRLIPDLDASYFYGEPDVLEDEVLFPEELLTESSNALYSGKANALEKFVTSGPDFVRFIHDLETDEELESSDEDDHLLEDEREECESEEDDFFPENEEEGSGSEQDETESPEGTSNEENRIINAVHSKFGLPPLSEEELDDMALISKWKPPRDFGESVQEDFYRFIDREKSKAFKQGWHAADLSPGGPERYREAQAIIQQMVEYNSSTSNRFKHYHTLRFLDVHPDRHRRVIPDARDARAMVALFFPSEFLSSDYGILHKDSLLLNQRERALNPPSMRESASERYKSKNFWEEWENLCKTHNPKDHYPVEWDVVIRPVIARLYKAGIIGPIFLEWKHIPGRAMTGPGVEGKRDFFIDLRAITEGIVFPRHIQRPPSKDHLLSSIRRFSKDHTEARFAALRLWSAPHFYPLMNGRDKRQMTAFTDGLDRAWEWNFVPKDMPHSDTSIHHTTSQRISAFRDQLGDRVLHRRDLLVVMGTAEKDLLKLTTAAIFAIQTEPWRLEVDLWRSFINIDQEFLDFLDELKVGWLD